MKIFFNYILLTVLTITLSGCAVNASKSSGQEFSVADAKPSNSTLAKLVMWRNLRFVNSGVYSSFYVDDKKIGEFRSGLVSVELEPNTYNLSSVIPSNYLETWQKPSTITEDSFVCNIVATFEAGKSYSFYFDQSLSNPAMPKGCKRLSGVIGGVHADAYGQDYYKSDVKLITKSTSPNKKEEGGPIVKNQSALDKPKQQLTETQVNTKVQKTAEPQVKNQQITAKPVTSTKTIKTTVPTVAVLTPPAATVVNKLKTASSSTTNQKSKQPSKNKAASNTGNSITDGGYQWKQTKQELNTLPEVLRGGYQLYNELYFYPDGYFLRLLWRLNPNNNQQENGSIKSGAWKKSGDKLYTQEYIWFRGMRIAYREVEYLIKPNQLKRLSDTVYHIRDSSYNKKGDVKKEPVGKNTWKATEGDGPGLFYKYLHGEFSEYRGSNVKKRLNIDYAKEQATTPTKWKHNQSIQPWEEK